MTRNALRSGAAAGLLILILCVARSSSLNRTPAGPNPVSPATTYYVSATGSDSYDGLSPTHLRGSAGPFRSVQRAADTVKAGDRVEIRGGTYQEYSTWVSHGTQANPITITAYGGEAVLISGNNHTIPGGAHDVMMTVRGDWCTVSDIQFGYSSGVGLAVVGDHCTIENVFAHHNWGSGIYTTGSYNLIVNCRAYNNSLINEHFRLKSGSWGTGISACRYPQYTTIRGCTAWDNWGEGISTFESRHITIEDCTSYNNQQNFYISDTKYCLFQRNLSYYTPGNAIQGYDTQNGILIGDEKYNPASSDNVFINNLVMGGERNLAAGSAELMNCLVANNTFVNASATAGTESACVLFYAGTAKNARFMNNIILQEDSVAIGILGASGLSFGYNNWSKSPPPGCRGSGDIIGDPKLLRTGPTGAGSLRPEWFRISVTSPARDRAKSIEDVGIDMVKRPRGTRPDMGALEAADPSWTRRPRTPSLLQVAQAVMTCGKAGFPASGPGGLNVPGNSLTMNGDSGNSLRIWKGRTRR